MNRFWKMPNRKWHLQGQRKSPVHFCGIKKSEEALRDSEEKFRTLIEQNLEGFILADEQGRVIEWNTAQERITGIPSQEALGLPLWDIQFRALPAEKKTPGLYEAIAEKTKQAIDLGKFEGFFKTVELIVQRPDGSQVYIQQLGFPIKTKIGYRIGAVLRDISDSKQIELGLKRRMAELEALHAVALAGTEAASVDDLMDRVANIIHEKLFPDHFGIALMDEETQTLCYHPAFSATPCPIPGGIPIGRGISGAVALSGVTRRAGDVRIDPDYLPGVENILSELCVPLMIDHRVVGVINLENTKLDSFDEADERLVTAIASELSTAMEKIRLLEAEQSRRKELEALERLSAALRREDDHDQVLKAALERIMAVMNLQAAGICLKDAERDEWVAELGLGEWSFEKGMHLPIDDEISQQVAQAQHYYLDNYVNLDPAVQLPDPGAWTPALLCLALLVDGATIGLLYLGRKMAFLKADVHLAIAMADVLANTLHRMELHQETQRQLERLTALRAIDQSILSSMDLGQTMEVLLEKITGLLKVDAANFLLYRRDSQTLLPTVGRGIKTNLTLDPGLKLMDSHAGRVALSRQMEFIADLSQIEDSLTDRIREIDEHFSSYLAVPLIARDELKGVLQIFHRTRLKPSRDWFSFLEVLAGQSAIAINSALLFNEQQQANIRIIQAYDDTIDGWSRALDLRDEETEGHSRRVTELTLELARRMRVPSGQLVHIRRGAQLHDIGKMGVPDSILQKAGPLNDEEWESMRQHPLYAANLLCQIEYLSPALEIPFSHHEKWDGSGYPQGLKDTEIPKAARIFAVIDVWDALTHKRWYRDAWPKEKALNYIREQSGGHFDPEIVRQFLTMIEESN
jgi:PAS domain S-box-containing protein